MNTKHSFHVDHVANWLIHVVYPNNLLYSATFTAGKITVCL